MRDILPDILDALDGDRPFAWARVVSTWGSAPRRPGAAMFVASPEDWSGSVSGGCVEHAVVDEALGTLATGRPQVVDYGVSEETAWSAGLSCGGRLQVLTEPFPACSTDASVRSVGRALVDAVRADRPVVLASPMSDGESVPRLLDETGAVLEPSGGPTDPDLREAARRVLADRLPESVELRGTRWFLQPFPPRDRLIIVGGSEIAKHLIPLAHAVEFETLLIDPRRVLADNRSVVVEAGSVTTDFPDAALARVAITGSTYAVLLTHEPAIDDPALHILLRSRARYIGALGGKKTQAERRERLRSAGFTAQEIVRIDGPVGVPIGAATPAEIAVSIVARMVERRRSVEVAA